MYILLIAVLIDLLVGDPAFITHPVVIIGRLISFLKKILRGLSGNNKFKIMIGNNRSELISGLLLVIIVVGITYLTTRVLIVTVYRVNYYLGLIINLWLLSTTIAIKGLAGAGRKIYHYLRQGDLTAARQEVGMIVGRDTDKMEASGVIRATVETVAENTSDGIIAPIFFYLVGGTPLAMAYKAVNTLDSMLGYRNEEYLYFGRVAARLDDLVNFLPARITGLGFCLAALINGHSLKRAFSIMIRDAGKHPSPNAGYPEGAVAGALGIRLGGLNYYQGEASFRSYLGDKMGEMKTADIKSVIRLMYWNTGLVILSSLLILKFCY